MRKLANLPCIAVVSVASFMFGTVARSAPEARSFDVNCSLHEQMIKAYNPDRIGYVSYSGPASFRFTSRMSFDLDRGLYRDLDSTPITAERIHSRGRSSLVLCKHSEGIERFDLRSNRFYSLQVASAYANLEVTGRCRRMKFSGIARNPRPIPRR